MIVYTTPRFDIDQVVMKNHLIVAQPKDAWIVDDFEIGNPINGKGTIVYSLSNSKDETIKLGEADLTEIVTPYCYENKTKHLIYLERKERK